MWTEGWRFSWCSRLCFETASMTAMVRDYRALFGVALLAGTLASGETPRVLTHRVWLLGEVPDAATLTELRAAGVDGLVLPVGNVALANESCRFTLTSLPDLKVLAGWSVTALVWLEGDGKASGDPATFAAQLAPVERSLPGRSGLLLVAKKFSPGLPAFASGVARRLRRTVELALPAPALAQHVPVGGWEGVDAVAVAFGNPAALGFPQSTIQDDLMAVEALDTSDLPYRAAIVVAPRADPPPGPAGASLSTIAGGETAIYRPGERGDVFQLRKPVDWGGVVVPANQRITVELVDTARYDRDLGMLLKPARPLLEGWDTVGLPAPEPTLGMSRQAFLEYLQGGSPYPRPEVEAQWSGPAAIHFALVNPTPQASAVASTGNWIELRFDSTEVRDVQLGDFSGMEYGNVEAGTWHRTVARNASAIRLYLTFLAPRARVAGCVVTFLSRPRSVRARWAMRVGDGSELIGPLGAVRITTP
jgi:hypothetical protein